MKVLLIYPDNGKNSSEACFLAPNYGIERMAAYLRKNNIEVDTIDPNIDRLGTDSD